MAKAKYPYPANCKQCGESFLVRKPGGYQLRKGSVQEFCSRKCAKVWAWACNERYRKGRPPKIRQQSRLTTLKCERCAKEFKQIKYNQRFCNRHCYHMDLSERYVPKGSRLALCNGCGRSFLAKGKGWRLYCSTKCRRKTNRQRYGNKYRHRARKYSVIYEPINVSKVFERDAWRCQVCGIKTPMRLRGTNNLKAPELDHRIPMAKGGPHTYSNVQCACRKCNLDKGARYIVGQIPLWST